MSRLTMAEDVPEHAGPDRLLALLSKDAEGRKQIVVRVPLDRGGRRLEVRGGRSRHRHPIAWILDSLDPQDVPADPQVRTCIDGAIDFEREGHTVEFDIDVRADLPNEIARVAAMNQRLMARDPALRIGQNQSATGASADVTAAFVKDGEWRCIERYPGKGDDPNP